MTWSCWLLNHSITRNWPVFRWCFWAHLRIEKVVKEENSGVHRLADFSQKKHHQTQPWSTSDPSDHAKTCPGIMLWPCFFGGLIMPIVGETARRLMFLFRKRLRNSVLQFQHFWSSITFNSKLSLNSMWRFKKCWKMLRFLSPVVFPPVKDHRPGRWQMSRWWTRSRSGRSAMLFDFSRTKTVVRSSLHFKSDKITQNSFCMR